MPFVARNDGNFYTNFRNQIIGNEGAVATVYQPNDHVPTIGYGYTFIRLGQVWGLYENLDADLAAIGRTLTVSQRDTLNQIVQARNNGQTALADTLISQFSAQFGSITVTPGGNADTLFQREVDHTADLVKARFRTVLNDVAAGNALFDSLNGTYELRAILDVAYLGPARVRSELIIAIRDGNRAEAWFQLRYATVPSFANPQPGHYARLYRDADIFGLYDSTGSENVVSNEAESKQTYQMLTSHRDVISAYETAHLHPADGQSLTAALSPARDAFIDWINGSSLLESATPLVKAEWNPAAIYYNPNVSTLDARGDDGKGSPTAADGKDRLENNLLVGSTGADVMYGGKGNDVLIGDIGSDTLNGGDDDDRLMGGIGDDTLNGDDGKDTLWGGANNDTLSGGADNDILYGGDGIDTLVGGEGKDILNGGIGNDLYEFDGHYGSDQIADGDHDGTLVINGVTLGSGWHSTGNRNRTMLNPEWAIEKDGKTFFAMFLEWTVLGGSGSTTAFSGQLVVQQEGVDGVVEIADYESGQYGLDLYGGRATQGIKNLPLKSRTKLNAIYAEALQTVSPLILDLDGDGVETLSVTAGVQFDQDGNGLAEQTGWVGPDDGLLVRDLNGNGQIDTGHELFGNNTLLTNGSYAENGFKALVDLDSNHNGSVESGDAAFSQLRVWKDVNSNGVADAGELLTLSQAGVQSIGLSYLSSSVTDSNGNDHQQRGNYTTSSGSTRQVDDVWFVKGTTEVVNGTDITVSPEIAALPDVEGLGTVQSLHEAMTNDSSGHLQSLVTAYVNEAKPVIRAVNIPDARRMAA